MKKLALALGLAVVATNASAAEIPASIIGSLVVPVTAVVVVTGAAIAAADNGGSNSTTGTTR